MSKRTGFLLFAATAVFAVAGLSACNKPPETVSAVPTAPTAGAMVADSDVTSNVKMAFQQSDTLKAFDINVVTLKGDVRLNGVLDSQGQIDEALRIARAANGAQTVRDELTIKK